MRLVQHRCQHKPKAGLTYIQSHATSYPETSTGTYSPYIIFTGDIVSYQDHYDSDIGWVREYRALGLATEPTGSR